jgi:hypothetical protein
MSPRLHVRPGRELVRSHWHRVSANLGPASMPWHNLRHPAATTMFAQGVPIEVVCVCSVMGPSASPPTSMAMCRRRPTDKPRTPWPRLCDEGLPGASRGRSR